VPEAQVVEPDQPGLGAEHLRMFQRDFEQVFGSGEARIARIHRRGGNAANPQWPRCAVRGAFQRVRLMRQMATLARRPRADQEPAVDHFHAVGGNLVGLVTRLTLASATVELVLVPWADHVLAIEPAPPQRPTDVIAAIGNHAESAINTGDGNMSVSQPYFAQR
jgi:hypothetical protein